MDPERVLVGWAHCPTGRDELVAITPEQRDALGGRSLACPACSTYCGATFEEVPLRSDLHVARLTDGRWVRGFVLR